MEPLICYNFLSELFLTFASMSNTTGKIFSLTTFGESHGVALGVIS